MSQVQVRRIYQNEQFLRNCSGLSSVNCGLLVGGIKDGWLIPGKGNIEYEVVFKAPAVGVPYVKGVWLNEDQKGYTLVDGTVADFIAKCNACCGDNAVITPVYNGVYPNLEPDRVLRVVTVQVKDDGSQYANSQALFKYSKYDYSGWARTSRNGGTGITTYTFNTYFTTVPTFLGPDNTTPDIVSVAAINYDSNVPGSLTTGQRYEIVVTINGNTGTPSPVVTVVTTGTLADLVTLLNGNATYNIYGTYSEVSGKIRLASNLVYTATLVITKVTP